MGLLSLYIKSLIIKPQAVYCYVHFTEDQIVAKRGQVPYIMSHSEAGLQVQQSSPVGGWNYILVRSSSCLLSMASG